MDGKKEKNKPKKELHKPEDNKIKELEQQIKEITNDLKRVQADFSNKCKQIDKEKQEFIEYASGSFICKLLPIVDELEISLKNIQNSEDKKGIQMILEKMKKLLSEEGVKEIKCKGEKFDPFKHEAIQYEEGTEEGKITQELQKGYELKGKLLRSAKVKITRLSNKNNKSEQKDLKQEEK
ncbi:nucleotide exchange factor GrpE [Candidatus Woesearchaeota archaeon]|nr:nucleotide exchange factor GrpE [Candidatus Woesearchaeota archaeon]